MSTLLANAANTRAQGALGDHPALMLSKGGRQAGTMKSPQKPSTAREMAILNHVYLSHTHWPVVEELGRSQWVNHDCLPGRIFQLLVRKGLSLGIRAGRSSTRPGAGVGGTGRPMPKLAGLGVMQWSSQVKQENIPELGLGH